MKYLPVALLLLCCSSAYGQVAVNVGPLGVHVAPYAPYYAPAPMAVPEGFTWFQQGGYYQNNLGYHYYPHGYYGGRYYAPRFYYPPRATPRPELRAPDRDNRGYRGRR